MGDNVDPDRVSQRRQPVHEIRSTDDRMDANRNRIDATEIRHFYSGGAFQLGL